MERKCSKRSTRPEDTLMYDYNNHNRVVVTDPIVTAQIDEQLVAIWSESPDISKFQFAEILTRYKNTYGRPPVIGSLAKAKRVN